MVKITLKTPFEILVIGPPVSGKGTQAKLLSDTFDIPQISAGQLLRDVVKNGHPLADKINAHLKAGSMVPHVIANRLIKERITQKDCDNGFVLDGYPRELPQAKYINQLVDIDNVFLIQVKDKTILERMAGRRVCVNNHSWHVKYAPSRKEGICDTCGKKLFQREDDRPKVVKDRIKLYHQQTDPLIKLYTRKKVLFIIDGEQHIEEVFQQIVKKMVLDMRQKLGL